MNESQETAQQSTGCRSLKVTSTVLSDIFLWVGRENYIPPLRPIFAQKAFIKGKKGGGL